jgi:hypothetical protein
VSKESRRASRNARTTGRHASTGPSGASRAGRRERVRHIEVKEPFIQRYRTAIIALAVVAVVAVVAGLTLVQATQAAYTCSIQFDPSPTPSPAPGASFRLGFAQDNMGASHEVSRPQRYTFCPPASGNHYNQPGVLGPIIPRVYGPTDSVGPPNWVHNLEHGAIVILYRGDSPGATDAGQQLFKKFFDSFPASPICQVPAGRLSPVIARFDQMQWPYAALVWGRVLPMQEWDPDLALKFYATESERLDAEGAFVAPPEPQCAAPSQSPGPSGSVAPSPAPGGSAAPSGSAAPTGSAAPAAPGSSPSPNPSS